MSWHCLTWQNNGKVTQVNVKNIGWVLCMFYHWGRPAQQAEYPAGASDKLF